MPTPKRLAVYAGSFDPLTNGHLYIMRQGAALFDELVVLIADNPAKRSSFSKEVRRFLLERTAAEEGLENVRVDAMERRFVVDYAIEVGARYMLRGVRNYMDFEYEHQVRHINADIARTHKKELETVFLVPPRELTEVASSTVKGLVGVAGWERAVAAYVPGVVFQRLLFEQNQAECMARYGLPALPEDVFQAYAANGRAYHTHLHLNHLFHELFAYEAAEGPLSPEEGRALALAIWLHDLVQDPMRQDNETMSLEVGMDLMDDHLSEADRHWLPKLILEGTRHLQPTEAADPEPLVMLMADLDLAILGQPPQVYADYAQDVRRELAAIPADLYRPARRAVLEHFLARKHLYHLPHFRQRYQDQAKANLKRELESLSR